MHSYANVSHDYILTCPYSIFSSMISFVMSHNSYWCRQLCLGRNMLSHAHKYCIIRRQTFSKCTTRCNHSLLNYDTCKPHDSFMVRVKNICTFSRVAIFMPSSFFNYVAMAVMRLFCIQFETCPSRSILYWRCHRSFGHVRGRNANFSSWMGNGDSPNPLRIWELETKFVVRCYHLG